jgi:hypothetical protein
MTIAVYVQNWKYTAATTLVRLGKKTTRNRQLHLFASR